MPNTYRAFATHCTYHLPSSHCSSFAVQPEAHHGANRPTKRRRIRDFVRRRARRRRRRVDQRSRDQRGRRKREAELVGSRTRGRARHKGQRHHPHQRRAVPGRPPRSAGHRQPVRVVYLLLASADLTRRTASRSSACRRTRPTTRRPRRPSRSSRAHVRRSAHACSFARAYLTAPAETRRTYRAVFSEPTVIIPEAAAEAGSQAVIPEGASSSQELPAATVPAATAEAPSANSKKRSRNDDDGAQQPADVPAAAPPTQPGSEKEGAQRKKKKAKSSARLPA